MVCFIAEKQNSFTGRIYCSFFSQLFLAYVHVLHFTSLLLVITLLPIFFFLIEDK